MFNSANLSKSRWHDKMIKEHWKYFLVILLISLLEIFTHWGYRYPDSEAYLNTMMYFRGDEGVEANYPGIMRPVIIICATIFSFFLKDTQGFVLVNSFFWISTALLLYFFALDLTGDRRLSLYTSLLFTTSTTMLEYGGAVLLDAGGYFFILFSFYLLHKYKKEENLRTYLTLGVVLGIGGLTREQTIPFFLIYLALYEILSGSRRLTKILYVGAVGGTIIVGYYLIMKFNPIVAYAEAKMLAKGYAALGVDPYGLTRFSKSLLGAFAFLPLFSLLGLYYEKSKENLIRYFAMAVPVLLILIIWPVNDYRFTFLLFPIVMPLASKGMNIFYEKLRGIYLFSFVDVRVYELATLLTYFSLMNFYAYYKMGLQFPWTL